MISRKGLFLSVILLVCLILPLTAGAAVFMADEDVSVSEEVNDNLYVAGANPVISGDVKGDLYVAGGNVTVTGNVTGDVVAAGGNVSLSGNVDGDIRVFGGSVNVNSVVLGEVVSFGGQVNYGPKAVISGELVAGGGDVSFDSAAVIKGQKRLFVDEEGNEKPIEMEKAGGVGMDLGGLIFKVLIYLAVAAVVMGFMPNLVKKYTKGAIKDGKAFWRNIGIGIAVLIGGPIVCLLLFISVAGSLLGGVLMVLYIMYILLNLAVAGFIFGALVQKYMKKGKELDWYWALGGVAVLTLVSALPFVGWIVGLVFFLWSLGAVVSGDYMMFRAVR